MMSTVRVITPHALPMFREDKPRSTRRAMEKARKDPVMSKQPDLPIGSKGTFLQTMKSILIYTCHIHFQDRVVESRLREVPCRHTLSVIWVSLVGLKMKEILEKPFSGMQVPQPPTRIGSRRLITKLSPSPSGRLKQMKEMKNPRLKRAN